MAIPTGCLLRRVGQGPTLRWLACYFVLAGALFGVTASAASDWPMLAHDAARSGSTATEIRPPFARKWYRLFPDEGLISGVQPVIAGGKVFVGTMKGILHAMDAETGRDVWTYAAPLGILHACAAGRNVVVFGCADGKVYALDADNGSLAWSVQTGAAIWNAPLLYGDTVLVGSRDCHLYAIDIRSGHVRWKAITGGPLLSSPAVDAERNRAYAASENMHVYAVDLADGMRRWRSEKLPGVSFRGYHPVVAPDGSVMVMTTPLPSLDSFEPILMDMVKEVFGDFASWRHSRDENDRLREANFRKMAERGSYEAQLDFIRKRLRAKPLYQTFFVLDPNSGRQKFVAPIVYGESMNGTGAPPLVTGDDKVIVKFQALLRSRYEHYSPFLNVGYLDTRTGHITPIMDQSRRYGWHDSLLLIHDEQCQLSAAGRVLINTHQDNVNAMDLDTLKGYAEPFCRGVHEPQPGEAVGIWAMLHRGQELPAGKEWLARGTAVYGGGSVLDTAVSIAGDSFYYIPTHETNAGAVVIAFRMDANGQAAEKTEIPSAQLTDAEWSRIKELPWDWDMLQMPRLDHVQKALPAAVSGTRQAPLAEETAERASRIGDSVLDRFIWEVPVVEIVETDGSAGLKRELTEEVEELISQRWQPLVFPPGKHPREAYRIFADPTETLLTLALAYPHVGEDLQERIEHYVARMREPDGPLSGPVGWRYVDPDEGAVRSYYEVESKKLFRVMDDIVRSEIARLYPLWLWAHASGEWDHVEENWAQLRTFVDRSPDPMEEDCRNGYVAGLIVYCRMATHLDDQEALAKGLGRARSALRERLAYEFAHPKGGLISQVPVSRSIFARWRHLTPEVGRLLANYAKPIQDHLMDVYVDYHRPTWFLAWGIESMWRNESAFALPTMANEIFSAHAWILDESPEKLAQFVDLPWCHADLFYIRKLVLCIEALGSTVWQPLVNRTTALRQDSALSDRPQRRRLLPRPDERDFHQHRWHRYPRSLQHRHSQSRQRLGHALFHMANLPALDAIPQILNSVFMGGGDDAPDLKTDAHIEGNVFRNYVKDRSNKTRGESNVISVGRGRDYVVVRNVFHRVARGTGKFGSDMGAFSPAGIWQDQLSASQTWTVNSSYRRLVLSETLAEARHESYSQTFDVVFDVSHHADALRRGENLLAIHGLNTSNTSSDFLISAMLEATAVEGGDDEYPYMNELRLLDFLRVSELMYRSAGGDSLDYIELCNAGDVPLDLTGLRFTDGIQFTFGPTTLGAGKCILVVDDLAAFRASYGMEPPVAGEYSGRLRNRGGGNCVEAGGASGCYGHTVRL